MYVRLCVLIVCKYEHTHIHRVSVERTISVLLLFFPTIAIDAINYNVTSIVGCIDCSFNWRNFNLYFSILIKLQGFYTNYRPLKFIRYHSMILIYSKIYFNIQYFSTLSLLVGKYYFGFDQSSILLFIL